MKRLFFEGYSDDTFFCEGDGISVDKDNCASGKPIEMIVEGTGGQMLVVGQYCPKKGNYIFDSPIIPG